jgi:uncharacterized protein YndB with AHSA1/START domain
MSESKVPDRIEKEMLLRAPRERVWRAISDAGEFGTWFGVEFDGPFVPGKPLRGRITPTKVDPEVAATQKAYEGALFEIVVDRVEPMRIFSFRWHPFAIDTTVDYSKEPTTLVVFELHDAAGGTRLTLTESGFDQVTLARRARAFTANDGGWTAQMKLIARYVGHDA